MRALTLLYHDVIQGEDHRESGFAGSGASRYKLDRACFEGHLQSVASVLPGDPVTVLAAGSAKSAATPVMLTFDDGGVSGSTIVAEELERLHWKAHFFITTDYIGRTGFLDAAQIRDLHARGHVIGTHSCSHPTPISALCWDSLVRQWSESSDRLSQLLGEPILVGSIPGGACSPRVVRAATLAGLKYLFTSQPTVNCRQLDGCMLLGRFGLERHDPARKAAALVAGAPVPRMEAALRWKGKQCVKRLCGPWFYRWRDQWYGEGLRCG